MTRAMSEWLHTAQLSACGYESEDKHYQLNQLRSHMISPRVRTITAIINTNYSLLEELAYRQPYGQRCASAHACACMIVHVLCWTSVCRTPGYIYRHILGRSRKWQASFHWLLQEVQSWQLPNLDKGLKLHSLQFDTQCVALYCFMIRMFPNLCPSVHSYSLQKVYPNKPLGSTWISCAFHKKFRTVSGR